MDKIRVMVAGLSSKPNEGKMAMLVAEAIRQQEDMSLFPLALSEENVIIQFDPSMQVRLAPTDKHKLVLETEREFIDLIVDFTLPKSVNRNAEQYCLAEIPFVMGTTGGDRKALVETVEKSKISAVIATNMAAPIVTFQAMIKFAAENFPNSLEGFKLVIDESHQAAKVDPSGTALSLMPLFKALGTTEPVMGKQFKSERDPVVQEVKLGISKEHLDGHAYHTYTMLSPDGTVALQFTHNILGRNVYVDGVLKAIRFLAKHKEDKGRVFSMADVLQNY